MVLSSDVFSALSARRKLFHSLFLVLDLCRDVLKALSFSQLVPSPDKGGGLCVKVACKSPVRSL